MHSAAAEAMHGQSVIQDGQTARRLLYHHNDDRRAAPGLVLLHASQPVFLTPRVRGGFSSADSSVWPGLATETYTFCGGREHPRDKMRAYEVTQLLAELCYFSFVRFLSL